MVHKYLNKLVKQTIPTGTVYQSTDTFNTINMQCAHNQNILVKHDDMTFVSPPLETVTHTDERRTDNENDDMTFASPH